MYRLFTSLCLIVFLTFGSFGVGWSGNFEKGADAYEKGDYASALIEWTPLAEEGHIKLQYILGMMYEEGVGVPKDYKTAVKWFSLAAEQGNARAQVFLGRMYEEGQGVTKDYKSGFKWFSLAAEQGDWLAQQHLSVYYMMGNGVIEDMVYSHMWANIAISNGAGDTSRDIKKFLSKLMTPSQIEKAQDLARECVKKDYKGC